VHLLSFGVLGVLAPNGFHMVNVLDVDLDAGDFGVEEVLELLDQAQDEEVEDACERNHHERDEEQLRVGTAAVLLVSSAVRVPFSHIGHNRAPVVLRGRPEERQQRRRKRSKSNQIVKDFT
jgi:hypothetical protein